MFNNPLGLTLRQLISRAAGAEAGCECEPAACSEYKPPQQQLPTSDCWPLYLCHSLYYRELLQVLQSFCRAVGWSAALRANLCNCVGVLGGAVTLGWVTRVPHLATHILLLLQSVSISSGGAALYYFQCCQPTELLSAGMTNYPPSSLLHL